jgi:hypothetical protein
MHWNKNIQLTSTLIYDIRCTQSLIKSKVRVSLFDTVRKIRGVEFLHMTRTNKTVDRFVTKASVVYWMEWRMYNSFE